MFRAGDVLYAKLHYCPTEFLIKAAWNLSV